MALDGSNQRLEVDGLREELGSARVESLGALAVVCRDNQDGNAIQVVILSHTREKFIAIHHRHREIEGSLLQGGTPAKKE
jgi:hypothetical protein